MDRITTKTFLKKVLSFQEKETGKIEFFAENGTAIMENDSIHV